MQAAAEGRPWTCPTDIPMGTAPAPQPARRTGSSASMARSGSSSSFKNDDDWGWDDAGGGGGGGGSKSSNASRAGNEYTMAELNRSAADKEAFFERQRALNASKPEGLRPSEGGKYVGFGSGAPPPARRNDDGLDDLMGSLASGLGSITQAMGRVTVQAGRAVSHTVNELQAGDIDQLQGRAVNVAQNVAAKSVEVGQKTWSGLKSMLRSTVNQLESLTGEEGTFGGDGGRGGGSGGGWGNDGWGNDGWGSGEGSNGNYSREELERSAAGKEDFFARKQAENANRRSDLPPSQGGKYAGFGSSSMPPRNGGYSNSGSPGGNSGSGGMTHSMSNGSMGGGSSGINRTMGNGGGMNRATSSGSMGGSISRSASGSGLNGGSNGVSRSVSNASLSESKGGKKDWGDDDWGDDDWGK